MPFSNAFNSPFKRTFKNVKNAIYDSLRAPVFCHWCYCRVELVMPHHQILSSNLLEYNSTYKLLICRKCRYAIQKSAIDSHLLRHKIYRRERQSLLERAARLDIVEPQLVALPKAASPAFSSLTVSDGLRCNVLNCRHLTISAKRMQKHWCDTHGQRNALPPLTTFSRPVKLQTFFRGTQNRYFEVTVTPNLDFHQVQEAPEVLNYEHVGQSAGICPNEDSGPYDLDMRTLQYLHHFSNSTYLTLPACNVSAAKEYWKFQVLPLALDRQWLMSGLLALAAFHMAFDAKDAGLASEHVKTGRVLSRNFERVLRSLISLTSIDDVGAQTVSEQVKALLHLAECAALRKSVTDDSTLEYSLAMTSDNLEKCAIKISAPKMDLIPGSAFSSAMVDQLCVLPSRIAETFGKPDNTEDVFAVLSGIATLVECCRIRCHDTEAASAWQGISKWVAECPKHLKYLVSKSNPAALVVTAFWYAILIKPIECCWYTHSITATAISKIRELLLRLHMQDALLLLDGLS